MIFKVAKNTGEFDIIDAGEYEAYVSNSGEYLSKNGKEYIAIEFTIRGDVDQKYKNRKIQKPFFKDNLTGDYAKNKDGEYWISIYAARLGMAQDTNFSPEDLIGLSCVITVIHYTSKNTGEKMATVNNIKKSNIKSFISNPFEESVEEDIDGEFPFD